VTTRNDSARLRYVLLNLASVSQSVSQQAWAHKIFIFRTEKNLKFQDIFQDISHKKRIFFVISGAHNFGTFRAEAKITIW